MEVNDQFCVNPDAETRKQWTEHLQFTYTYRLKAVKLQDEELRFQLQCLEAEM